MKLPFEDLNLDPYSSHFTNTYIYYSIFHIKFKIFFLNLLIKNSLPNPTHNIHNRQSPNINSTWTTKPNGVFFFFWWILCTVHKTSKLIFSTKTILKLSPMIQFTYLKIISLQCFQFLTMENVNECPYSTG